MSNRANLNAGASLAGLVILCLVAFSGAASAQTPPQSPNAAATTAPNYAMRQQQVARTPKGAGVNLGYPPLPGETIPGSARAPARQNGISPADAAFLTQATQGAMLQEQLGKVEAARGTNINYRQFAMLSAQNAGRIKANLEALASKLQIAIPTMASRQILQSGDRLDADDRAVIDRDYFSNALPAEQRAVDLFANEARSGQNQMLRNFAKQSLPALQQTQRTMIALSQNPNMAIASLPPRQSAQAGARPGHPRRRG